LQFWWVTGLSLLALLVAGHVFNVTEKRVGGAL
jgi:hypothetical protein